MNEWKFDWINVKKVMFMTFIIPDYVKGINMQNIFNDTNIWLKNHRQLSMIWFAYDYL